MNTIKTKTGWEETTTKLFNIKVLNHQPFMTVAQWVDANERLSLKRKFKACDCCKKRWSITDQNEDLYLAITDKGNKVICLECFNGFYSKGNKWMA